MLEESSPSLTPRSSCVFGAFLHSFAPLSTVRHFLRSFRVLRPLTVHRQVNDLSFRRTYPCSFLFVSRVLRTATQPACVLRRIFLHLFRDTLVVASRVHIGAYHAYSPLSYHPPFVPPSMAGTLVGNKLRVEQPFCCFHFPLRHSRAVSCRCLRGDAFSMHVTI